MVLLENRHQWEKVKAELERLPHLKTVVMMAASEAIDHPMVMAWSTFMALGDEEHDAALEARLEGIQSDDVGTFIYTSGTTGPPKAVMLTHGNLAWTASAAIGLVDMQQGDSSVSYLPLSHIAEQMFSIHGPVSSGSVIWFAESLDNVAQNLQEVQPTVIFGVPRIWEKMHAGVSAKLDEATGLKGRIVAFARSVGREVTECRNHGRSPSLGLKLRHAIAHKLLFSKVKPLMGLGNARMCVTGAAPISAEVLQFFAELDLTIHEVYGQSEDCGPTSFNTVGHTRYGTVGRPIGGTEVALGDDGEIRVRGPHVFKGYYKDAAATDEALDGEWLCSGDLGAFTDEGYLTITGRKKEIIITAGGKNIAPKNIEAAIRDLPLTAQAVVIGDRRKFLSALITLDPEAVEAFATERGIPVANAHGHPAVVAEIQRCVDERVNPLFARVEHIRKFTLLPRDFSVDEGELTPTLKIKRSVVQAHFEAEIEAMYA